MRWRQRSGLLSDQYEDVLEEAQSKPSTIKQQYSNWLVHKSLL